MGSRRLAPPEKTNPNTKQRVGDNYGQLPLSFERNEGQTDSRVDFLSRGPGYSMFFSPGGEAAIVLSGVESSGPSDMNPPGSRADLKVGPYNDYYYNDNYDSPLDKARRSGKATGAVLRLKLVGANAKARAEGRDPLPGKVNYLLGTDRHQWRTGIPTFAKVAYEGIYPGVDLIYYGNHRQLEYDFVVHPGADPRAILLEAEGADAMEIDPQGDLVLYVGARQVRHRKPVVYQVANGVRREIDGRYELQSARRVSFQLGSYDPTERLVIDPVLVYSTYLGGTFQGGASDGALGVVVDATGNAYVTGHTYSSDFPTTAGVHDTTWNGQPDAFVTKLDSSGATVLYSTFLGGSSYDIAEAIAVDAAGQAYVTGYTGSANFPTTAGAHDTTFNGQQDVFVTKLDAAGMLEYSTFLGGTSFDAGLGIAVDTAERAYVTGRTESSGFPTTVGARDTTYNAGLDAFVTALDSPGTLVYSTFLGGSSHDVGYGVAVDGFGNAYLAGYTLSSSAYPGFVGTNFPTTFGAHDTSPSNSADAFVAKLNAAGATLLYSTFLGGSSSETAQDVEIDAAGNIFVVGSTYSNNFPTTAGAFDTTLNNVVNLPDTFVTKFNTPGPPGAGLAYSTYLGGGESDFGHGVAIDVVGNAYVTGYTYSGNFPTTAGAYDTSSNGDTDAFVAKLNPNGTALTYSTLVGGTGGDIGADIGVDPTGHAIAVGRTLSAGFPTTPGALNTSNSGFDGFVTKLTLDGSSLAYSTYLGGSFQPGGQEVALSVAVDSSGSAYVTGYTVSADFPTTYGAYDTSVSNQDVFVTKLDASGSTLVYSTVIGGSSYESSAGIAVDAFGYAYVIGSASSDFPTTPGAHDTTFGGGSDGFVTKLDPTGSSLVYSTFLGGSNYENARGIALDAAGAAYVTGDTLSENFPTTPGAYKTTWNSGYASDAFLTKLNPNGSTLEYSTLLGGTSSDLGYQVALDFTGAAYVTGHTYSNDFPTTIGAYDETMATRPDAFVTKLDAMGATAVYSTLLGGTGGDYAQAIAVDGSGDAYVTGYTDSSDFPTTIGAHDAVFGGGSEAFVTKLDAVGAALAYSTFLGGIDYDEGHGIAVDADGNAHVTGITGSSDFPTTEGAYDTTLNDYDAFLTRLDTTGAALVYSTFFGGSSTDVGQGFAIDADGNVYVTGYTSSSDFPTTSGAYDTSYNGGFLDVFVFRMFDLRPPTPEERLADLEDDLAELGLEKGPLNSLTVKLQGAAQSLTASNVNATCGKLGAFINEVQAQSGKKIPAGDAAALITEAEAISEQLGCS